MGCLPSTSVARREGVGSLPSTSMARREVEASGLCSYCSSMGRARSVQEWKELIRIVLCTVLKVNCVLCNKCVLCTKLYCRCSV